MSELETAGYRGWWPVRLYTGKDKNGVKQGREVFRNMVNGELYDPGDKGWNGSPPYPTGGPAGVLPSELYRINYDLIKWEKCD